MPRALTLRWHQKYQASHESHRSQRTSLARTPWTGICPATLTCLTIPQRSSAGRVLRVRDRHTLFLAGLEGVVYTCG